MTSRFAWFAKVAVVVVAMAMAGTAAIPEVTDATWTETIVMAPHTDLHLVLYTADEAECSVCPQLEELVARIAPKYAKLGISFATVRHSDATAGTIRANKLSTIPALHAYTERVSSPYKAGPGTKPPHPYTGEAFSEALLSDWLAALLTTHHMANATHVVAAAAAAAPLPLAPGTPDGAVSVVVLRDAPLLALSVLAFKHRGAVSVSLVDSPDDMAALWARYNPDAPPMVKVGLLAIAADGSTLAATDASDAKVTLAVLKAFLADAAAASPTSYAPPPVVSKDDAKAARAARAAERKKAAAAGAPSPAAAAADDDEHDDDAPPFAVFATKSEFTDAVILEDFAYIVYFYSSAGAGAEGSPEWDAWLAAASSLASKVKMAVVDVDTNTKTGAKYAAGEPLPRILAFPLGAKTKPVAYDGALDDAKAVRAFALSHLPNFVVTVKTAEAASAFFQHDLAKPKIVLFSEADSVSTMYKVLARDFKGKLYFAQVPADSTHLISGMSAITQFPALFAAGSFGGDRAQIRFIPYPGPFKLNHLRAYFAQLLAEVAQIDAGVPPGSRPSSPSPPPPPPAPPLPIHYYAAQPDMDAHCPSSFTGVCLVMVLDAFDGEEDSAANLGYRATLRAAAAHLAKLGPSAVRLAWTKADHIDFVLGLRLDAGLPALVALLPSKSSMAPYVGALKPDDISSFAKSAFRGRARTYPLPHPMPSLAPSPLNDYEYSDADDADAFAADADAAVDRSSVDHDDADVDADTYAAALAAAQAAMNKRKDDL